MSNPFDIPTPPKKRTPNPSRDDYEGMFPSSSSALRGDGSAENNTNVAARMYADEEEEDSSPWGTNTRYTQSADYHRSIDTEVRSSGGGQTGGGMMMAQSGGYFGRGDYEEEEEELEDEEDGTQGTNTQRSSYNSAMQTQSTTAGGSGGGHMVRSSLQSGGSMTPPQATSPNPNNPGRTSTSSLRTSVSAESYKSFGNRLRNVIKQSQEQGSRVKARNDARAEELAMNRRYKGGQQLLVENQRQEVTTASSYGTLDQHQSRSLDVSRDSRDERGGAGGVPPGSAQKKLGFFARRRGASSESVDQQPQQQQPPQTEGDIKSKKSLKHKMKSLQRRTGQMVLETVRVVDKPKDDDFNNLWRRVQKSDKVLQQLGKESAKFLAALKEVSLHSKEISTLLLQFAEGDESEDPRNHANAARTQGGYEDVEFRKQKDLVTEKATKLLDVTRSIDDRIIPMCADAMQNSFGTIRDKRLEQFPAYQPCVDKRTAYMRDMDAYERRLETAQNAKKKDMEYIDKSKRKAELSQNRFQTFSSRLVEDLVLFDGSRSETCGELVDTFAESLNFTVDREQDVLRLVGGSDK